ncbi:MerR family transcriptional regulator [Virgibacillus sp. LDC-1]|uniref:MerR family transcriptional regulator n=1 Tax=Virgibacillus sp. LDC-1 TaxID=3039856 RepID=UPI0024DF045D|nr:MerR family transcriptional regulator [Virgibacillus sp. LDC-1]
MQIKEVAKELNISARTIRFYEKQGLIQPAKKPENDYRVFSEEDVLQLTTITALREVGMPIKQIKVILEKPEMTLQEHLEIQRTALLEKWVEMKDMLETLDEMITRTSSTEFSYQALYPLAAHLKKIKEIRYQWTDRWNFDGQAHKYDQRIKTEGHVFNVHEGYEAALAMVENIVQKGREATCLDIGIGTGNLGSRFLSYDMKVIGVDQSEKMLEKCKEKHPEIECRKGHFLILPIIDNQIDVIVSSYALHHLPDEEKLLALEEMTRVLKPFGQICIADLMLVDEVHRHKVLEGYRERGNTVAVESIEDEYYANQALLVSWFEHHGFLVETYQFNDILSMIYAKCKK